MSDELWGHCLCGQTRYVADAPVLWAGHCHCESCRRATSAAYASWFGVRREGLSWAGPLRIYESSDIVRRGFCGNCGSPMFYQNDALWPDECHLYGPSLDDPEEYAPQAHFHFAEHLGWVPASDGLPKYAGTSDGAEPLENTD